MEELRQYIVSVVAGACICGIALDFLPDSRVRTLLKLLCGMILALTVLRPVSGLDLNDLALFDDLIDDGAYQTAALGEAYGEKLYRQCIKDETAAYILDKAKELGVTLTAEVGLDEGGIPVLVRLRGDVSPYVREQLSAFISRTLGISKENQVWTS